MRLLNSTAHAYLDLVVVVVFALAPSVIGLEGSAAILAYVLAAVHLLMTVVTASLPVTVVRWIPLTLHGLVEAAVGVALAVIGLLAFEDAARWFYLSLATVILVVFVTTAYQAPETEAG